MRRMANGRKVWRLCQYKKLNKTTAGVRTAGVRIEKDNGSVSKEMRMRWWKLTEVMLLALWG